MKKVFIILMSILVLQQAKSQDMHYSQMNNTPLQINPGLTGNFNGLYRLIGSYRNQFSSIPNTASLGVYNTYSFSFDAKLFSEKLDGNALAVGVIFNGDHAGNGSLTTNEYLLSVSYRMKLDRYETSFLTFGLMGGLSLKRVFMYDLLFESQIENYGFNPNIPSGETKFDGSPFVYKDLNLGVVFQQKPSDVFGYQIGMSIYHVNKPVESFSNNPNNYLPSRINIHGGFELNLDDDNTISPSFLYMRQASASQTNIGFSYRKKISDEIALNGMLRYRVNDAFILGVGTQYKRLGINVSYDITGSNLSTANKSNGAFELTLNYIFGEQNIGNASQRQFCPTF
jgi:type IX secretion system PorP/SprF family membrane protein